MNKEILQAWRTIYAVLQETGYDTLYQDEITTIVDFIKDNMKKEVLWMKVNYVLMYGTPYLKYKEFETFEDVSKFLVNKSIVDYSIFEKMNDEKEVEMIYRDNDINYLENKIKEIRKEIEETDDDITLNLSVNYMHKALKKDLLEMLKLKKGDDNNEQ